MRNQCKPSLFPIHQAPVLMGAHGQEQHLVQRFRLLCIIRQNTWYTSGADPAKQATRITKLGQMPVPVSAAGSGRVLWLCVLAAGERQWPPCAPGPCADNSKSTKGNRTNNAWHHLDRAVCDRATHVQQHQCNRPGNAGAVAVQRVRYFDVQCHRVRHCVKRVPWHSCRPPQEQGQRCHQWATPSDQTLLKL